MSVSEGIKEIRQRFNITQADMAHALEVSRLTYLNKENGKTPFTVEEFIRAVAIFENLIKMINDEATPNNERKE